MKVIEGRGRARNLQNAASTNRIKKFLLIKIFSMICLYLTSFMKMWGKFILRTTWSWSKVLLYIYNMLR